MGYGFRRGFSTVVAAWDRRNDPPSPSTLDIFAVRTQLSLPAAHDYEVFDWMGNALPVPQWPLGPPFLTREPIYLRFTAQPVLTLAQGAPGR